MSSLISLFTAGLACFAPLAAAYTQPKGSAPAGNPINNPGLAVIVPAGKDYSVTWQPTTPGTVTLVLLKGPSNDAVAQYAIAENIPNNGKFVWTPSKDLAPSTMGYGIELIVDATGQYQYSTQFGIENADYQSAAVATTSGTTTSSSAAAASASASEGATTTASAISTGTSQPIANTTTSASTTLSTTVAPSGSGTGAAGNTTVILPTKPMTVPASLVTTTVGAPAPTSNATVTANPPHSNGAAHVATSFLGLVVAAGVAVMAL